MAESGAMTASPVEGFLEEPTGNGKFGNVIRTRIKTTCAGRKAKFDRLLTYSAGHGVLFLSKSFGAPWVHSKDILLPISPQEPSFCSSFIVKI